MTAADIQDFLGSVSLLAASIEEMLEKRLLWRVAGKRLTYAQFRLLKVLMKTHARTIRDVALFLRVSNAAASKASDKLVRLGLLCRAEAEDDRREIRLSLTDTSLKILGAYDEQRDRVIAEVFAGLPALQGTTEMLDRISAALLDGEAEGGATCFRCGIYYRDHCVARQLTRRRCFYERADGTA